MKAIILAGGSGSRLWPLSRTNYPKQFLKINSVEKTGGCAFDSGSLIQQTVSRLLKAVPPQDVLIISNREYKFHVKTDVEAISEEICGNMLLEPVKRNTAPALALAVKYCSERLGCPAEEVIFVSPSDHVIVPEAKFIQYLRRAEKIAAEGFLVTFGIKPVYPETGYGYIRAADRTKRIPVPKEGDFEIEDVFFPIESFTEKPDQETAQRYLKQGGYFWNSGMFAFTIQAFEEELGKHAPEIHELYTSGYENMLSGFESMPDISIDYAVMEKSERVVTMPLDLYWNDVGSWDSIFDLFPKDSAGNVTIGDVICSETSGSLIMSDKRLIAAVGLENLLVVETDDAILITKRGEAQRVKKIVETLNASSRKEASEHTTTYRPWGNYTVLEDGERYKIKRIVINRGEKLSLQMHHHRSEHWVVIKGTAMVTIGDKTKYVHENESVYIPKSTLHRLENPGKVPLEIIEVQNGEYVKEDDIVRVEDLYGR